MILQNKTRSVRHQLSLAKNWAALHTSHFTLHTAHCKLSTTHNALHTAHYTQRTAHYTLYSTQFIIHKAYCKLQTTHFTQIPAVNHTRDKVQEDIVDNNNETLFKRISSRTKFNALVKPVLEVMERENKAPVYFLLLFCICCHCSIVFSATL